MATNGDARAQIDQYLAGLKPEDRDELERVRGIVRRAAPEAVEAISYQMPAFKLKGKYLIAYAAFKDHLSLFPTGGPVEELREELEGYKLSKGTIQFSPSHPLPEQLILDIVASRMRQL